MCGDIGSRVPQIDIKHVGNKDGKRGLEYD